MTIHALCAALTLRRYRSAAALALLLTLFLAAPTGAQTLVPPPDDLTEAQGAYRQGDHETAYKSFRSLAEQGDPVAQRKLGAMYYVGLGVPQDSARATEWYGKAAEQGHAPAQHNLGFIYWQGRGVPQDYVQAHFWSNLAAAQGHDLARELRDRLADRMTYNHAVCRVSAGSDQAKSLIYRGGGFRFALMGALEALFLASKRRSNAASETCHGPVVSA